MDISARSVKARNLRRTVGQAVQQLYLASRLHLLYSEDHENVRAAYDGLAQRLAEVFTVETGLRLTVEEGYLFANDLRIRVDSVGEKAYEWIVARFAESGIAAIKLRPDVKPVELKKFLPIFAKAMWLEDGPPPAIQRALEDAFVMNVGVTMRSKRTGDDVVDEDRVEVSARELAVGLYFKMIRAAAELTDALAAGSRLSLKRVRYLIQLAVDTFIEDDGALVTLARVNGHRGYLANHMANACVYALALGNRVGLSRRQLLDLGTAGLCFDVGMVSVPPEVRDKPEMLTPAERELIMYHPLRGADALLRAEDIGGASRACAVIAAEHHLVGYPRAIDGVPGLLTSIVAVADAFDSLTTSRPFRPALSPADALRVLMRGEGGHDRLLVRAFANVLGVFPTGTVVELDSGETGVVAQQNPDPALGARPLVRVLLDGAKGNLEGAIVDVALRRPDGGFARSISNVLELDRDRGQGTDLLSAI